MLWPSEHRTWTGNPFLQLKNLSDGHLRLYWSHVLHLQENHLCKWIADGQLHLYLMNYLWSLPQVWQMKEITKKDLTTVTFLRRIKHLEIHGLKDLYNGQVYPFLEYVSLPWTLTSNTYLDQLEKVQRLSSLSTVTSSFMTPPAKIEKNSNFKWRSSGSSGFQWQQTAAAFTL